MAFASADEQAIWREVELAAVSQKTIEGTVVKVARGGVILDVGEGVRAFMPAGLIEIDVGEVAPMERYDGATLAAKVIEINRARRNLVVSRRAVLLGQT